MEQLPICSLEKLKGMFSTKTSSSFRHICSLELEVSGKCIFNLFVAFARWCAYFPVISKQQFKKSSFLTLILDLLPVFISLIA